MNLNFWPKMMSYSGGGSGSGGSGGSGSGNRGSNKSGGESVEQPPIQPTPVGALRFNTDSAKLEYFDGNQYVNITTDSPEQNTGGTRGIFAGGYNTGSTNNDEIEYVNIESTGNSIDFGNLAAGRITTAGFSNGHGGLG